MQILVFLVYLGSVVITENNEWRKVLIFHRKKTSCIIFTKTSLYMFPLNPKTKLKKREWDRIIIIEDWL